jgi:hypothetical protein
MFMTRETTLAAVTLAPTDTERPKQSHALTLPAGERTPTVRHRTPTGKNFTSLDASGISIVC